MKMTCHEVRGTVIPLGFWHRQQFLKKWRSISFDFLFLISHFTAFYFRYFSPRASSHVMFISLTALLPPLSLSLPPCLCPCLCLFLSSFPMPLLLSLFPLPWFPPSLSSSFPLLPLLLLFSPLSFDITVELMTKSKIRKLKSSHVC